MLGLGRLLGTAPRTGFSVLGADLGGCGGSGWRSLVSKFCSVAFDDSGSPLPTPKKLATASHEVLIRDFSSFGLAGSTTGASASGTISDTGLDVGFGGVRPSVFLGVGVNDGVPSKFANEFQWSDIQHVQ